MRCERGQATIEWVGLVLLASLALGALVTAVPVIDGRSLGGFLSHRILCAIAGRCDAGDKALARAYGDADAALLRRYAPDIVYEPGERSLPVDFRQCRMRRCAEAPDDPDLDAHRTGSGLPAVAFTRVVRRGGSTYLQYWFYYPDSNSRFAGSDRAWDATAGKLGLGGYPGYHRDDWEGYQVRLGAGGGVDVRASSHGHYQWCKQEECNNRWGPRTGWTRVSSGSRAGRRATRAERTATATSPSSRVTICMSAPRRVRGSAWCRWRRSTAAPTGRSTTTSIHPGRSRSTTTLRAASRELAPPSRPSESSAVPGQPAQARACRLQSARSTHVCAGSAQGASKLSHGFNV